MGLIGAVVIGVSCIAPAYTLTAALGPTVSEVGVHLPAIFLVGFIPMLLVALGYRELNNAMPDAGTSFTWASRAFGPWIGWMGGWGLIAATIIVLSNLAAVAVDFFYLMLAQLFGNPDLADLSKILPLNIATTLVFIALACWISYRGMETTKTVQYVLVAFQLLVLGWLATWPRSATSPTVRPLTPPKSRPTGSTRLPSIPSPPSRQGCRCPSSSTGAGTSP